MFSSLFNFPKYSLGRFSINEIFFSFYLIALNNFSIIKIINESKWRVCAYALYEYHLYRSCISPKLKASLKNREIPCIDYLKSQSNISEPPLSSVQGYTVY